MVYLDLFSRLSHTRPSPLAPALRAGVRSSIFLALGHKLALSLLTLMLGGALATKPRATKRDATTIMTTMIRFLGFGLERDAEPQPVD